MKVFSSILLPGSLLLVLAACSDTAGSPPTMEQQITGGKNVLLENPTCEVPGNPANWVAAFCMWMNRVGEYNRDSDLEDDPVKLCIRDLDKRPGVPKELCERNKYFKQQLCESLALEGKFKGSIRECLASRGTIPRVVREGL